MTEQGYLQTSDGSLALPAPDNLYVGLLQVRYGGKARFGRGAIITFDRDPISVRVSQIFDLLQTDRGSLSLGYFANTTVDKNNTILLWGEYFIDIGKIDEILANPRQTIIVYITKQDNPRDENHYSLVYELIEDVLKMVDAKYFISEISQPSEIKNLNSFIESLEKVPKLDIPSDYKGTVLTEEAEDIDAITYRNFLMSLDRAVDEATIINYKKAISSLAYRYHGILSRTKEEIEAKSIDGLKAVEEIVDKLLPAIAKKLRTY